MERISVRRGTTEDVRGISRLTDLNGLPRPVASEETFLVAESGGEVLAALEYRFEERRLLLGRLVADPFVEERPLAEALYREARVFARSHDLREVAARSAGHGDYLRRAGYRHGRRGWALNAEDAGDSPGRPAGGWRRVLALWGRLPVPFFREVGR